MKSQAAVYLLKWKSKVVYVGASNMVLSRLSQHIYGKRIWFDSVEILESSWKGTSNLEQEMIKKHNPYYNRPNPGSRKHKRLSTHCPHCGAHLDVTCKNGVARIRDIPL